MILEKIGGARKFHADRQICMTVRAKILVLLDQFRRFVVLEMTARASLFAEYRFRGHRSINVPVCIMALQTGVVLYAIERLGMAVLTLSPAF